MQTVYLVTISSCIPNHENTDVTALQSTELLTALETYESNKQKKLHTKLLELKLNDKFSFHAIVACAQYRDEPGQWAALNGPQANAILPRDFLRGKALEIGYQRPLPAPQFGENRTSEQVAA